MAVAATLGSSAPVGECRGAESAPGLSHVVLAVAVLDTASASFRQLGFRLKPGRLHPNNLLNRHVKFRDGSGIELMTVHGIPGDALARRYAGLTAGLAAGGGGGAYVALDVPNPELAARLAATLGLEPEESASGSWRFVGFPDTSSAAALFFAAGVPVIFDPDSLVSHTPDVSGLAEAWLEGGSGLITLLEGLGAVRCGTARSPDGREGDRIGLRNGAVVVVPAPPRSRPRVLGAVLTLRSHGDAVVWPHQGFWIQYRFSSP